MDMKTELQKVSEETMRYMRGTYVLDEVAGNYSGVDCLKFRQGKKAIVTVYIYDDRYDFQIIYGKAEREKFEAQRSEFSSLIQEIYDNSRTYHDGKWMMISVNDLETLEAVKQMVAVKKKPNRKPTSEDVENMSPATSINDVVKQLQDGI